MMTSLKRPLEMELMLLDRTSSNNNTNNPGMALNSAKTLKRRCMLNTNDNNVNNIDINTNTSDSLAHFHHQLQQIHQSQQHHHHHNHHQQQQNHNIQHVEQRPHSSHQQINQQPQQQPQRQHNLVGSPFKDLSIPNVASINDDLTTIIRDELHQPSVTKEAPVLSLRQTQIICEKLVQLRERKLKEEYDKILMTKLAEQYDTFVKYTHDHIERQYHNGIHQASYLS